MSEETTAGPDGLVRGGAARSGAGTGDVEAAAALGLGSYHLTLSWPRLEPRGDGDLAGPEVRRVARALQACRRAGVASVVHLGHDLPAPLQAAGGWAHRATAEAFGRYAARAARALGDAPAAWVTLREPWGVAFGDGAAEVRRSPAAALAAAHHLAVGHGLAARALRAELGEGTSVGVVLDLSVTRPADPTSWADLEAVAHTDAVGNHVLLGPVLDGSYPLRLLRTTASVTDWSFVLPGDLRTAWQRVDTLGVRYSGTRLVRAAVGGTGGAPGWVTADHVEHLSPPGTLARPGVGVEPAGLTEILAALDHAYPGTPLAATVDAAPGAGAPGVRDAEVARLLREHVDAVRAAADAGVPVREVVATPLVADGAHAGLVEPSGAPTAAGLAFVAPARAAVGKG